MGNVLSLMDQSEEESYTQRYNYSQQYQTQYPLYTTTRNPSAPYNDTLTSTEEVSTRQTYEQARYERSKREKAKRKELEIYEHEQEEYARKLREQEALEKLRLQHEREKHETHYINDDVSSHQYMGFESNRDVRQNVEYDGHVWRERFEHARHT
ncbi:hypothetical protein C1645_782517 [Glomus cerebriforme]|uniref:Uncharacterized protein n=1 Tax=Glomus cerebriforme TaxID=658196 RepID=A0A397SJU6_9GLOM|nr:hypothetical protein C1645_782517 [Glomus cerebriforme]